MDDAEKRGQLIRHLEHALAYADELEDGHTGYLIERALDEARSRQFRPIDTSPTDKWESWHTFLAEAAFSIGVGALGTFVRYAGRSLGPAVLRRRWHRERRQRAERVGTTIIGAEVRWFYAYDGQGDDAYSDDDLGQSGCRARLHRQWQRRELGQAALRASGGSPRQHQ
jgi:hypothetical protein